MSQKQFKVMQGVIYITLFLIYLKWSSEFSVITECLLFLLMTFTLVFDEVIKYIKQWNTKKCIENKKEFVLDIFFAIFLFFALSFHSILKYYKV